MAKMSVQGLDEYALRLSNLSKNTEQIVRQAVYEGAGVVADSIKSGLRQIPVDNGRGTEDRKLHGVTNRQKADLIDWHLLRIEMIIFRQKLDFPDMEKQSLRNIQMVYRMPC